MSDGAAKKHAFDQIPVVYPEVWKLGHAIQDETGQCFIVVGFVVDGDEIVFALPFGDASALAEAITAQIYEAQKPTPKRELN